MVSTWRVLPILGTLALVAALGYVVGTAQDNQPGAAGKPKRGLVERVEALEKSVSALQDNTNVTNIAVNEAVASMQEAIRKGFVGAPVSRAANTPYKAETDGFVILSTSDDAPIHVEIDVKETDDAPWAARLRSSFAVAPNQSGNDRTGLTSPIRKGETWKAVVQDRDGNSHHAANIFWMPLQLSFP